ncbi:hypothetical protein BC628DRAFT_1368545 [Trametes gibbosa]|nr:hypothetical protein BC628DRAFT_1368545 [Trametes gibbosa]
MPRFLDTFTGQFIWRDTGLTGKYAVLSHLWDSGEQSYQAIRKLQGDVAERLSAVAHAPSSNSTQSPITSFIGPRQEHPFMTHPALSTKIKNICRVVREAGFRLLWMDSCCVNRSSSLELAETIHSSYELFEQAAVCYAYLHDVPDPLHDHDTLTFFLQSKWHTRIWTLQDLIAPTNLIFLSRGWHVLGTKRALADVIHQLTGVHGVVFTGKIDHDTFGIARRMSWAAQRKTSLIEDQAYALMGIFGVRMPLRYGEGREAFLRLQLHIMMKTEEDHTLFAWGPSCTISRLHTVLTRSATRDAMSVALTPYTRGLLALSPCDFHSTGDVFTLTVDQLSARIGRNLRDTSLPRKERQPNTILIRLHCIDLSGFPNLLDHVFDLIGNRGCVACTGTDRRANTLALLQCEDGDNNIIALPLSIRPARHTTGIFEVQMVATHEACANFLHMPIRVLRIKQVVLGQILECSSLTAMNLSFPLDSHGHLHNTPTHPVPCNVAYTPDYGLLYFDLGDSHSTTDLVPPGIGSAYQMRKIKFEVSPLRRKSVDGDVVLTTALVSDFPHQSGGTDGQHLRFEVTLSSQPVESSDSVKATFSVMNYVHTLPSMATGMDGSQHIIESVPCADKGDCTRIGEFSMGALAEGSLVSQSFLVYADDNEHVRRLSIWLSVASPFGPRSLAHVADGSTVQHFVDRLRLSIALSPPFNTGQSKSRNTNSTDADACSALSPED